MTATDRTAAYRTDTNSIDTEQELADIALTLRGCLARLDRVGAGIAAIHVNAAIEHLAAIGPEEATGLGAISGAHDPAPQGGDDRLASIDQRLLFVLPGTGRPH